MPTVTPKYKGWGEGKLLKDFTKDLKSELRSYYPHQEATSDPYGRHPADNFVEAVLASARGAIAQRHWMTFDLTKDEFRAEQADMLKRLNGLLDRLENISLSFERLLDVDSDRFGTINKIKEFIEAIERTGPIIERMPKSERPREKHHKIAVRLAVDVLRTLAGYGIANNATATDLYVSNSVKILKAIGDDIGLRLAETTWRDSIIEAKQAAPDLQ